MATGQTGVMANSQIIEIKKTHLGQFQYNKVIDLDGNESEKRLTYMDSTASALPDKAIQKKIKKFNEEAYANTHTEGHHRGRDSTAAVDAARNAVGELVNYDKEKDVVIFKGAGATAPLNYLAGTLFPKELRIVLNEKLSNAAREEIINVLPDDKKVIAREMIEKPIIITTEMEHHANLITWYRPENVKIVPVDPETAELDQKVLKSLLEEHKGKVRLVTVTGASNVTGIMNPIHEIAKMAHEAGAEICVDAAQLAPHHGIEKRRTDATENLDYVVMSPHKFGVPNTPGVIVADSNLIAARRGLSELGGAMIGLVTAFPPEYTLTSGLAAGEEPGTPNIPGIVATGLAAAVLKRNMPKLTKHEKELTRSLMEKLQTEDLRNDIHIVGSNDPDKRVGVVSISVKDVSHEIVTAFLNDSWNIAVRNGCFCAHPLMISTSGATQDQIDKVRAGDHSVFGYVRMSFGEHSTHADVNTAIEALTQLVQNKEKVKSLYEIDAHGTAVRKDGWKQEKSWDFDTEVEKIVAKKEKWARRAEANNSGNVAAIGG